LAQDLVLSEVPCKEWQGRKDKDGYAMSGRATRVAREVFMTTYGYVPPVVMHTCDNPPCIEPTHLLAGTKRLNSIDMARKGRQWKQKITPSIAAQVRAEYKPGVTRQVDLAERFGVDQTTISKIVLRKGVI
jgi:hypothetical protein